VRSLKLHLQKKYMDFSLTLFFPVLIMLFLSSCSEWPICIERFSYALSYSSAFPNCSFHKGNELCFFLKIFLQENENTRFQLLVLSPEITVTERQPSMKSKYISQKLKQQFIPYLLPVFIADNLFSP